MSMRISRPVKSHARAKNPIDALVSEVDMRYLTMAGLE
jgi:hypothetical protein